MCVLEREIKIRRNSVCVIVFVFASDRRKIPDACVCVRVCVCACVRVCKCVSVFTQIPKKLQPLVEAQKCKLTRAKKVLKNLFTCSEEEFFVD